MRRLWFLIPLVAIAVAALLWSQRPRGPILVSGVLEAHDIRVGSRVGGRIRTVHAEEGARVAPGAALITLEPFDLNERLKEAESLASAAQSRLDRLVAGYRAEEIEQARAARDRFAALLEKLVNGPRPLELKILEDKLAVAGADFRKAESDHLRLRELAERGSAVEVEMTDKTRNLETARARLAQATDELALAKQGTREEEISEARSQLAQAQAVLSMMERGTRPEEIAEAKAQAEAAVSRADAIRRQLAELEISSPCEAIVESISLRPGDMVAAGAPVVTLIDASVLWVRTYVPEKRAVFEVGKPLRLRVDSIPGREFKGHVSFIAREAEFTPANAQTPEERSKQVFRVKVQLDEGLDVLRPGMLADVIWEP